MAMSVESQAPENNNGKRKRLLQGLTIFFVLLGLLYALYWGFIGRFKEYTDDAYVSGNLVQLTPQVTGIVVSIGADDTNLVQQGQVIVKLDDTDARLALAQTEANLAKTIRDVRQLYQTAEQLQANVAQHEAELNKVKDDLKRRQNLIKAGAVSKEILQHNQTDVATAEAALNQAQHQYEATHALIENTTLLQYPTVLKAESDLRTAYLNLQRTALRAPITGYIAKRSVQLGQQVSIGMPLLAIVPLNAIWVDANFKESQLKNLRIGQPVTLISDIYGSRITYQGKIQGLAAGTGSVFSLLPPQNATGNWIKIVQRVPVRVVLDAQALKQHPLRVGLSMAVTVDTHNRDGHVLAQTASSKPVYDTHVFANQDAGAEELIAKIVKENS